MSTNRMEELHSFLTEGGRELVNVKFFPGTARGLNNSQVAEEARAAFSRAFDGGLQDCPPMSGQEKASL